MPSDNESFPGSDDGDDDIIDDYITPHQQSSSEYTSGLTMFLSEKPDDSSKRIRLIIQQKRGGKDTNGFDDEIVAIIDELIEYIFTSPQQKAP